MHFANTIAFGVAITSLATASPFELVPRAPASCVTSTNPRPPPYTVCGLQGTTKNPQIITTSQKPTQTACRDFCLVTQKANCISFSYGPGKTCKTYSKQILSSNFQQGKTGVTFWNRHCYVTTCSCPSGQTNCSGQCFNLTNDSNHCGSCTNRCDLNCCNSSCTNIEMDNSNCGGCGRQCGQDASCNSGSCSCPSGSDLCNGPLGDCTNIQGNDNSNCGGCGQTCGQDASCNSGSCTCPSGSDLCNGPLGDCTNIQGNDNANCGGCGQSCGQDASCNSGSCSCPSGSDLCNGPYGDCTVTQGNDNSNCGGCGQTCGANASCNSGSCTCPSGSDLCNGPFGDCTNIQGNDNGNCGGCGITCPSGSSCYNGGCVCNNSSTPPCNGACPNYSTDNNNCGTCGNPCTGGNTCNQGSCSCTQQALSDSGFETGSFNDANGNVAWGATSFAPNSTQPAVINDAVNAHSGSYYAKAYGAGAGSAAQVSIVINHKFYSCASQYTFTGYVTGPCPSGTGAACDCQLGARFETNTDGTKYFQVATGTSLNYDNTKVTFVLTVTPGETYPNLQIVNQGCHRQYLIFDDITLTPIATSSS